MIKLIFSFIMFLMPLLSMAQILSPVEWNFSTRQDKEHIVLIFKATIQPKWHVYGQDIGDDGPVATSFRFNTSDKFELIGKVTPKEKPIEGYDNTFQMNIAYFKDEVIFEQKIKNNSNSTQYITGYVEYMACDDERCLPPEEIGFTFEVKPTTKDNKTANIQAKTNIEQPVVKTENTINRTKDSIAETPNTLTTSNVTTEVNAELNIPKVSSSNTILFLEGFLFGLLALLMPCIFPMIPLTVSYFTKSSSSRAVAIKKALLYGFAIIFIYVFLGLGITIIFGASTLNDLASNATANLIFFIVLLIFGASFLGAFELTLPSSWATIADKNSEKSGFVGIFFMALALALASFSCTGPLIGSLLVEAAAKGSYLGPAIGMIGFSLALAIPFTLFAIFPNLLQSLPKSGGWLNSIKVTLGFIEIAFALKFLSNVDLAYHWGILDREVFLVLWITIFTLLGFYLLGKLKFAHDSDLKYISVKRLFLSIISFSFALYMIPGLWGAPLKAISAFVPPMGTQDFILEKYNTTNNNNEKKKYANLFHSPLGLNTFFDYEEGIEYAKKNKKPVLVDFTGHSCVNCRKMEANVWADKQVLEILQDDYVIISLYVDDKTALNEHEIYTSALDGKKINTIGKKWSDLQASKFNTNSQPYYVLMDYNQNVLTEPSGYNSNIQDYIDFLNKGKNAFYK